MVEEEYGVTRCEQCIRHLIQCKRESWHLCDCCTHHSSNSLMPRRMNNVLVACASTTPGGLLKALVNLLLSRVSERLAVEVPCQAVGISGLAIAIDDERQVRERAVCNAILFALPVSAETCLRTPNNRRSYVLGVQGFFPIPVDCQMSLCPIV